MRSKLSIVEDLLLFGNRIVVPKNLHAETLCKTHYGTKVFIVVVRESTRQCDGLV